MDLQQYLTTPAWNSERMRPRKTPAGEIRRGREVPKPLEFFERASWEERTGKDMGDENYSIMKNIKSMLSYDFY